jgi:hypothetical protein
MASFNLGRPSDIANSVALRFNRDFDDAALAIRKDLISLCDSF